VSLGPEPETAELSDVQGGWGLGYKLKIELLQLVLANDVWWGLGTCRWGVIKVG